MANFIKNDLKMLIIMIIFLIMYMEAADGYIHIVTELKIGIDTSKLFPPAFSWSCQTPNFNSPCDTHPIAYIPPPNNNRVRLCGGRVRDNQ